MEKKMIILFSSTIVAIILIVSLTILFFNDDVDDKIQEPTITIDNKISPYLSQQLTVEILRIRNRGIIDKMLTFGTSWKNPPTFYYVADVDGEIADTSKIEASGGVAGEGTFNEWDTIRMECRVNYKIPDEQITSDIELSIMEIQKSGFLGRNENHIEKESIHLEYNYRTGHWTGDDYLGDQDGYGHVVGDNYEFWFNIYQSDYDHDSIPFWAEVNIYGLDPTIDDSMLDPDNDGIPSDWEWKYGYDPLTWDNHQQLDPDIDGIENIEEYMLADYFSDPYSPDIYIEVDGMEKNPNALLDWEHIFYKESQQMVIERLAQHNINVYIDDGWPDGPVNGGGEMVEFVETLDEVVGGHMARWYKHNFADERKGVFRYFNVANNAGFITPSEYNTYDHIVMDSSLKKTYTKRYAFTPRWQRVVFAKGALHELGHSLGLVPGIFPGIDNMPGGNMRYPDSLTDEEYQRYNDEYQSVMNYNYIFNVFNNRKLFDYSNGENSEIYDFDDWAHIYVPSFQVDSQIIENPAMENFDDFDIIFKDPEPVYKSWIFHMNLTKNFNDEYSDLFYSSIVDKKDYLMRIYVKDEDSKLENETIYFRIYIKPIIDPVVTVWSLVSEGIYHKNDGVFNFYSFEDEFDDILDII